MHAGSRRLGWSLALALVIPLTTLSARQGVAKADTVITLTGENGISRKVGLSELRALPQVEYALAETDGVPMKLKGPTLRSVLTLAKAPAGQNLRGVSMSLVVVAEGIDGYRVIYSLAELDEQFGERRAIIALTQDGAPLSARDGPFRIVMADESHRARWVRSLTSIRIFRVDP